MIIYKIRRKSDGLYSSGTASPKFTKVGKMWRKQHLHSHLSMLHSYRKHKDENIFDTVYKGCEVVVYNLTESASQDIKGYVYANTKLR